MIRKMIHLSLEDDLLDVKRTDVTIEDIVKRALEYKKIYNQYYRVNPIERLADINSYSTLINVLRKFEDDTINLYKYELIQFREVLLRGYELRDIFLCPTRKYLKGINQSQAWTNFEFYNPNYLKLVANVKRMYSLPVRLKYGLPITIDEHRFLVKKLNK